MVLLEDTNYKMKISMQLLYTSLGVSARHDILPLELFVKDAISAQINITY